MMRRGVGMTRSSMALLALAPALLLGACSKKAGGQVVAVVNGDEITQQELRSEAQLAQIPPSQDFQTAAPGLLQRVIERNLLAGYARDQGLDRGPEFVARRRQLEQTLLATLALRKLTGAPSAVSPTDVQKFINDRPTTFARREKLTLDQLQFPAVTDPAKIKALTALGSLDAIEAKLRADGVRVARGKPVLDTATIDPAIAKQIVALPAGEIFDLTAGGATFISVVTARAPATTPPETWTAPATEAARRDAAAKSAQAAVETLRAKAKIDYDPAYRPALAK